MIDGIYGAPVGAEIAHSVEQLIAQHAPETPAVSQPWSVDDVWLITYADQFVADGEAPLRTLARIYDRRLAAHLNGMHILPFYPWTSDDGFSVSDYEAVDPRYGSWDDVMRITGRCRTMFDAVINHMSAQGEWFQSFLAGDPDYAGFFATADPGDDLSSVVRPRTHPLLTAFDAAAGTEWVWTTFSADQVDLDYGNPKVMLRVLGVLLDYARRGAVAIRLDAIGFLWKELGTSCLHLPETHAMIQLFRACLDDTYPAVQIITETNVPHAENVSYFGDGAIREAQAVYQFPLPPLVLHSLATGDASLLTQWAATIGEPLGPGRTYFNFLSSHDGVGLRPLEGFVDDAGLARLLDLTTEAGGEVSYRSLPDGSQRPYELNSTWFDLMAAGHDADAAIARHLASHAIAFALPGLVGLYVHSLFGTGNDREGFALTGRNRTLNRRKFGLRELEEELADPASTTRRVFDGMTRLIAVRRSSDAFSPEAPYRMLDEGPGVFAIERRAGTERARVYVDVTGGGATISLDEPWRDLETGEAVTAVDVAPFTSRWLRWDEER